jgi:DNA-binding MarR family transcriptional regulator
VLSSSKKLGNKGGEKYYYSEDEFVDLWFLLAKTRHAMLKFREKELRPRDITPGQAHIILAIKALGDKATPAEISERIYREASSTSEHLDRMEKKGLIVKVRDFPRKNFFRIELTEKGIETYNFILEQRKSYDMISALSKKQRQELRSCLYILLDKLD